MNREVSYKPMARELKVDTNWQQNGRNWGWLKGPQCVSTTQTTMTCEAPTEEKNGREIQTVEVGGKKNKEV